MEKKCYYLKSIKVLCQKSNINITDLITGEFQKKHPLKNKSFKEQIKKEFEK